MPHHLLAFLVGSIVVTVVPGADMALVTRQVVTRGRAAAQVTIRGNLSGLVVHATALALGLSGLLVASATAYSVVKLAGAAYLAFLGVQSLRQARRTRAATDTTLWGAKTRSPRICTEIALPRVGIEMPP
jgi:threonine/homoserine/homoserine lactone efflux protein